MNEIIFTWIPPWLLYLFATATAVHRWYISIRYEFSIISRWENVIIAIAITLIAFFYLGRWLQWWDLETAVAISRLVWIWLLTALLYSSHRMAIRHVKNGLE